MGVLQFLWLWDWLSFCVRQDPSLEYGKRNSRSGMFRIVPKFKKEKLPKKSNPPSGKSVLCVCVRVCVSTFTWISSHQTETTIMDTSCVFFIHSHVKLFKCYIYLGKMQKQNSFVCIVHDFWQYRELFQEVMSDLWSPWRQRHTACVII